jgi:hypothetical protein
MIQNLVKEIEFDAQKFAFESGQMLAPTQVSLTPA